MKKAILLLLFVLPNFIFAQKNFAPMDATWRYHQHDLNCNRNYLRYNVENEIEIDGKDCSVIYAYTSQSLSPFERTEDSLIVWENDNKVYFYQFEAFHLLYDFNMEEGDTLQYFLPTDKELFFAPYQQEPQDTAVIATELYVKDVEEIEIGGLIYKKFNTLYPYPENGFFNDMGLIIEHVGSLNAKIIGDNQFYVAEGCGPGFQCYENDFFNYPDDEPCAFPTSTDNVYTETEITIFPNPTFGTLHIDNSTEEAIETIELRSITGQQLKQMDNQSTTIDLGALESGMYVISLRFESGGSHVQKVIKY